MMCHLMLRKALRYHLVWPDLYYLDLPNAITFWYRNHLIAKKGQLSCLHI